MSPDQFLTIQRSFDRIEPELDTLSAVFFQNLLRQAPSLRRRLPQDLARQRAMFAELVRYAVRFIHRPGMISEKGVDLMHRHNIGALDVQYVAPVGMALAYTLRDRGRGVLNAKEISAWMEGYSSVANLMIKEMLDQAA